MAVAARMDTSATPAFGVRNLALLCGLDYSTVAKHLKRLREHPDPLIVRIVAGRGRAGDRYQLRVPDRYQAEAAWRRWRGGRIETVHPAFHGTPTVALVYETLSSEPTGAAELGRLAMLSSSATTDALRTLAAYKLAERGPAGWRRGDRSLDQVAIETGADTDHARRLALYREQRRIWWQLLDSWQTTDTVPPQDIDSAAASLVPWPRSPDRADLDLETANEVDQLPAGVPELDALVLLQATLGAVVIKPRHRPEPSVNDPPSGQRLPYPRRQANTDDPDDDADALPTRR
ncbi:hypothetical protein GCM10022226_47120 [Sphaerisporangium flaviroseum]|uniref:Transcriptional regulator n=1 Tax=Sphaerisporangium flaviroseum TaxID=509199 RepID=A0ABP7ILS7_9ACTN